MYIQPNTTLKILKYVALDNTYENTIQFSSLANQTAYFNGKAKYTHSNLSYQRATSGVIMIQRKAEDLFDCNYLMFQNSSFGNKWFYAFINKVEYVDNITCKIEYEIDEMQTWHFDYVLKECFVEREHSLTDVAGDNIVEEGLELGEIQDDSITTPDMFSEWTCVIASIYFYDGSRPAPAHIYNDVWSGVFYLVFTGLADLNNYLNLLLDPDTEANIDGILAMYMYPTAFTDLGTEAGGIPSKLVTKKYNYTERTITDHTGVAVRNKKLNTYPYNYLQVTDFGTSVMDYRFEFFTDGNISFNISGEASPNTEFMCAPYMYNGVAGNNFSKACRSGGFPMCSINVDSYNNWLAQNKSSLQTGVITNALISGGAGALTGGVAGAVAGAGLSLARGVADVITQSEKMKHAPDIVTGRQGSGLNIANGIQGFSFIHKAITKEYQMIIDDYFDMFGYATRKLKVPNRTSRPHWNYVKTTICNITGNCPAETVSKIKSIYNHGITFWRNGESIGNYSLDNTV